MSVGQQGSVFKKALRPAASLFAIIGFVDVIGRLILLPFIGTFFGSIVGKPSGVEINQVIPSPDGSMKAIVYSEAGPAFAAGCTSWISVVEKTSSNKTSWGDSHRVYEDDCSGGLGSIAWEPPAQGRVRARLRINADPAKALAMSRYALGGTVAVAFINDP